MSFVIIDRKKYGGRPSVAEVLTAFGEAITALEAATISFVGSITREQGGDFALLQALWAAQDGYRKAAVPATELSSPEANELWERARAASRAAREELERSKRFNDLAKRRKTAHAEWAAERACHQASVPREASR